MHTCCIVCCVSLLHGPVSQHARCADKVAATQHNTVKHRAVCALAMLGINVIVYKDLQIDMNKCNLNTYLGELTTLDH